MKQFTISLQDDGIRLSRYLERVVPGLYPSLMHKALRNRRIKRNGKRTAADERLVAGDTLDLYLNDDLFETEDKSRSFLHASNALTIVYEDANFAVLYKPAGLLCHDDSTNQPDTLVNRFLRCLYERGEYEEDAATAFVPALCHRLDQGTSGLLLAAKKGAALTELGRMQKEHLIQKRYLAITIAQPPANGVYTAYLKKDQAQKQVSDFDHPAKGTLEIATSITTIAKNSRLYLLEIGLLTGRTHQIRAHLAHLRCPILGDGKYGDGEVNRRYQVTRQALAAYKLHFVIGDRREAYPLLSYLDGQSFTWQDIWFRDQFFPNNRMVDRNMTERKGSDNG